MENCEKLLFPALDAAGRQNDLLGDTADFAVFIRLGVVLPAHLEQLVDRFALALFFCVERDFQRVRNHFGFARNTLHLARFGNVGFAGAVLIMISTVLQVNSVLTLS